VHNWRFSSPLQAACSTELGAPAIKDRVAETAAVLVAGDVGSNRLIPQGTLPYVQTTTTAAGNYFETLTQQSHRLQFLANVLARSRHRHGTHELSAGFNTAVVGLNQVATRTEIDIERADGTLADRTTFAGPAMPRVTDTQAGFYVQDTWHPDKRFVISAGLRVDGNRLTVAPVVGQE
jgi:outer membrane receptor protein involved in Fe transport